MSSAPSRIVFDRADDSTPYDLAGHLTDWQTIGLAPTAADGHRWPARNWAPLGITGGYNARDPHNRYHGRHGLTARILCTPDYTAAQGSVMTLVSRGEAGPETYRQWPYRFELIVQPTFIYVILAQWDIADATHRTHVIGTTGRPPPGHPMALAFVLDGQTARAYHDGQRIGAIPCSPTFHTADTPITVGHRWRSATGQTQNHYRGTVEYIELADHAGTDASERLWYETTLHEPDRFLADLDALSPIRGPNWQRYRQRPLADTLAETRGQLVRLQRAALAPHCDGDLLATHEAALGLEPDPTATVEDRQLILHQASQIHLGHRPADLAAYAAQLYQVPAEEIAIFENSNARTVATEGLATDPIEDHWIRGPGPGTFAFSTTGLQSVVPTAAYLARTGTYLYQGVDLDPSRGKHTLWLRATMTDVLSSDAARCGVCWGHRGIQTWLTVHEAGAASWDIYLTTPNASTRMVEGLDDPSMTFDLRFIGGALTVQLGQAGTVVHATELPTLGELAIDRIGLGIRGTDIDLAVEARATWTAVTLYEPDSGVNYNAAAYHPAPTIKRTALHSALLTRHADAVSRIVAQCHEHHMLDASPLDYTLLRQPDTGA